MAELAVFYGHDSNDPSMVVVSFVLSLEIHHLEKVKKMLGKSQLGGLADMLQLVTHPVSQSSPRKDGLQMERVKSLLPPHPIQNIHRTSSALIE